MRALSQFAAALLFASGMVYAERAGAQNSAPIELKWIALEGCPRADTVLARAYKIAGPTKATGNTLRADASVTQTNEGLFRLRLELHYENLAAVRNIEGKSCKDLAGAAAVVLALLLSSEETLSERDLAGEPGDQSAASTGADTSSGKQEPDKGTVLQSPSTKAAPAIRPAPPSSSPSVESGPPRRWHVLLTAPLGSLSVGPMAQVSRSVGGGVGLSFDRWRFLAEGKLWATEHETISNLGDEYEVALKRSTVGARGCRVLFGARFEFAPCALISAHHLSVHGSGPNLVSSGGTVTWAAVGIGARARILITPWLGLVADVDGELELARPEVSVSLPLAGSPRPTAAPLERLAPAAATITVGAEWIL